MRIGIIGAGNMSEAMMAAWLRARLAAPEDILLADIREDRLNDLRSCYGVGITCHNHEAAAGVDVLVLGVKPQQLDDVLGALQTAAAPRCLVLSIAAGKRLAWLQKRLPAARWIRVMPNIACRTGEAMSVFTPGDGTTDADRRTARSLLEKFGRVLELPETAMDTVTAISGSGPAFFARMLRAIVSAAAAADDGVRPEQALLLAAQTMRGTASLLLEGGMKPQALMDAVSSARGVTVAGLEVMDRRGFDEIMGDVLAAAVRRSRELAESSED